MSRAIEELRKIIQIEGLTHENGATARAKALECWISEWVTHIGMEQSVIKTNLDSEEEDFVKYYLATQMGDLLMNECIDVTNEKYKIKAEVLALRR